MNIGLQIKRLRKELKMTQAEFSQKTGISRSYLSDVENGRYHPSLITVEQIATKLNMNVYIEFREK